MTRNTKRKPTPPPRVKWNGKPGIIVTDARLLAEIARAVR